MTTWQFMCAILIVYGKVHQTFTLQQTPIRIAPTASSTCPFHRIVKLSIESNIFTRPCSCGGAGWTRVAYLNMSDRQQTCPSHWILNYSSVRVCGQSSTCYDTCDSVDYPVNGRKYSSVCV